MSVKKDVESTDTRSITKVKISEDSIDRILTMQMNQ